METTTEATTTTIIGVGGLSWPRGERVSDRYGTVGLIHGDSFDSTYVALTRPPEGMHGRLVAVVKQGRRSSHIGDLFRGIGPLDAPLADGTERVLGSGAVFLRQLRGLGVDRPAPRRGACLGLAGSARALRRARVHRRAALRARRVRLVTTGTIRRD